MNIHAIFRNSLTQGEEGENSCRMSSAALKRRLQVQLWNDCFSTQMSEITQYFLISYVGNSRNRYVYLNVILYIFFKIKRKIISLNRLDYHYSRLRWVFFFFFCNFLSLWTSLFALHSFTWLTESTEIFIVNQINSHYYSLLCDNRNLC